jgi:uncharacterized protein DUF3455
MKIVGVLILALATTTTALGADRVARPLVPGNLVVDEAYRPFLVGHAMGTQNYICAAINGGIDWLPIGPQATVFDDDFEQMLTHFQSKNPVPPNAIQATWQHSKDTSAVWAVRLRGSTDASYVAPDAIEWLLLHVTATQFGPNGGDKLSGTAFIQRVNTVGGKPPAGECTAATLNTRALVPYEADYYFYR